MPESLTPITREETYLAAIAGEEVSVPDPICRKEAFLDAIDTHIGSVEGDVSTVSGAVTALQTQIPASTAGDEGKVLTAGSAAGTASWQTPSGGGEVDFDLTLTESGGSYTADKTFAEVLAEIGVYEEPTMTCKVTISSPSTASGLYDWSYVMSGSSVVAILFARRLTPVFDSANTEYTLPYFVFSLSSVGVNVSTNTSLPYSPGVRLHVINTTGSNTAYAFEFGAYNTNMGYAVAASLVQTISAACSSICLYYDNGDVCYASGSHIGSTEAYFTVPGAGGTFLHFGYEPSGGDS